MIVYHVLQDIILEKQVLLLLLHVLFVLLDQYLQNQLQVVHFVLLVFTSLPKEETLQHASNAQKELIQQKLVRIHHHSVLHVLLAPIQIQKQLVSVLYVELENSIQTQVVLVKQIAKIVLLELITLC